MTDIEDLIDKIPDSLELDNLIGKSKNITTSCGAERSDELHKSCFINEYGSPIPQCPNALVYLVIGVISRKPSLYEDGVNDNVAEYFKTNNIKASGLVSHRILSKLYESKSQILTWLKYEKLLVKLIKEQIYETKTLANEVLATVKDDLSPEIACKFSSVMSACIKYCRETSGSDEEEEEKWCEIIDWISWFIAQD